MLEPKKIKYRKQQRGRGRYRGRADRGGRLAFGSIGLKAMVTGELTARQIEAARRAMTRAVARGGQIWIRIFPDIPVSHKAAEVPMGSGKGAFDHYAVVIKQGAVLFEMDGLPEPAAREALRLAGYKLPLKTKVVTRLVH
jgi:large subunit ribosomal protein L16